MEGGDMFASTPEPPYYAVVFTSLRRTTAVDGGGGDGGESDGGYSRTAERMVELASGQPGFLGVESARGADGLGITVSYWTSEEAIANWKNEAEHTLARERGRQEWYDGFELRVAKVERAYAFRRPPTE